VSAILPAAPSGEPLRRLRPAYEARSLWLSRQKWAPCGTLRQAISARMPAGAMGSADRQSDGSSR
jgi:hypothetical protein